MAYYACREVGERGNAAHLLVREACGDVQFLCDAAAHKWPYDRSGLVTAPIERILDQNPLLVRQLAVPPGWNVDLNGVGLWQNRINDPEHGRRVLPPTATADEMMAYLQIADINVDIGFMLEIYEDFYPIRETDVPILERFLASDSIENRGSVLETLVERGKFNGYEADLTLLETAAEF
jgi:hypothetical protein